MSDESDTTGGTRSRNISLSDENGENREQDTDQVDAAARDHSYLPGTSNPLFPASLLERRRERQRGSTIRDSSLHQLAILELEGVVLFPGCTLPLRLRNSPWVDYLGRKIDASRDLGTPNEEVRIGVVTQCRSGLLQQQRRRSSWMRTSFTTGSGQRRQRRQRPLIADPGIVEEDEEDEDNDEEDEEEGNDEEEEIEDTQQEVYQSGHDSALFAPEPQQAVYDVVVRFVAEQLDRIDALMDQIHAATRELILDAREIASALSRINEVTEIQESTHQIILSMSTRGSIVGVEHDDSFRQYLSRHQQQNDFYNYILVRKNRLQRLYDQTIDRDSLIGRVGTIATISYTFDALSDVLTVGTSQAPRDEARSQLAVTALGTNRFRIVARVEGDDVNDSSNRPFDANGMSQVRLYWVEELPDHQEFQLLPKLVRPLRPSPLLRTLSDGDDSDQIFFHEQEQVIRRLSKVSSVPYKAYKSIWPWRLVGLIRTALDRIPTFDGLRKNLPSLESHNSVLEPTSFSFWMASNMSLTEEEKLDLLKMLCTVERLRFILAKVLEQEEKETSVCCSACHSRLSSASSMFSVGGAEGTTGAYVNEYGVVHQTITLREADETNLAYSGGPEIRDRCFAHLGWKFQLVRADATEDRPEYFFGWSASSVTFV